MKPSTRTSEARQAKREVLLDVADSLWLRGGLWVFTGKNTSRFIDATPAHRREFKRLAAELRARAEPGRAEGSDERQR